MSVPTNNRSQGRGSDLAPLDWDTGIEVSEVDLRDVLPELLRLARFRVQLKAGFLLKRARKT